MASDYMLFDILQKLTSWGHTYSAVRGPNPLPGDVGIMHVDATRIDEEYLAAASRFTLPINFKARDISKRAVSRSLLSKDDRWDGQVLVKSDLNCWGSAEARHNAAATGQGKPAPFPEHREMEDYLILPSIKSVEENVWRDPGLVVERFVPERDGPNYALRTWVFFGPRERCTRHVGKDPIVKGSNIVSRTPVPVPDVIRAERERLGFDYGKFDFVIYEGTPLLLDANRTPSSSAALRAFVRHGATNLAAGLHEMILSGGVGN